MEGRLCGQAVPLKSREVIFAWRVLNSRAAVRVAPHNSPVICAQDHAGVKRSRHVSTEHLLCAKCVAGHPGKTVLPPDCSQLS